MRPRYLLPLLSLLCTSLYSIKSQAQSPQPLNEASLLWEISGNGLRTPSFVFGTIHMIPQKDFLLTDATRAALEQSKNVVFEINIEKMDDITTMLPMIMQAFMKRDTTLRDLLEPSDYEAVKQHFQTLGLPMFLLDRIKPMFLSALDPQTMMGKQDESITSYEMELMAIAKKSGKTIGGLETAAFQMSMFDSIPYRVQAKMLVESIRNVRNEDEEGAFDQMIETYKQQDIEAMQQLIQSDGELMAYENLLLFNRNRNWVPLMNSMMRKEPCFFAVGAGHLGGLNGILQLLRQEGFIVKALK
jgi:hypothetical protein